jgi:uncharacterized RDD family membrane protein YckC
MSSNMAAVQDAERKSVLVYLLSALEDQEVSEAISKHLRPIIRDFPAKIELDSDFNILGGTDRDQHKNQLFEADIVLALISSDFISDDDVYDRTKRVIERHNNKQTVIIPLLVRNCMWKTTPFARLEVLPRNYQPLNNKQFWNSPDDALMAVVTDIYSSLNQLVQSGGVQLSSTDAAKPWSDPAFTSETAENQTALLDSTPREGARSTTEQRVLSEEEKAFYISGIPEISGGAAEVSSQISVDWRRKYNRFVVTKRGAALLIDYVINLFIVVPIVASVAKFAGDTLEFNTEAASLFGFGVTYLIICPMMESSRWCGTFGKIIMRIQITDRDGNRITFWRAFRRNVTRTMVFWIYFCTFGLGFIWQIVRFRKTKKLFHDGHRGKTCPRKNSKIGHEWGGQSSGQEGRTLNRSEIEPRARPAGGASAGSDHARARLWPSHHAAISFRGSGQYRRAQGSNAGVTSSLIIHRAGHQRKDIGCTGPGTIARGATVGNAGRSPDCRGRTRRAA